MVLKRLNRKVFVFVIFLILCIGLSCTESGEHVDVQKSLNKPFYNEPRICSECHNVLYEQWDGDMHHVALVDPFYVAEAELAGKEAGEDVKQFCHSCHSPVGVMRKEIPKKTADATSIANEGVFCDFCHTVKETKGVGNASYVNDPGNIKRGPFDDSKSLGHETTYSELHTKGEFCGMCHDVKHPTNNLVIENTYTEWKEGPYAKEGTQCQDCHMTPGPGVTKPNPGRAALGGPERDMIYTHYVVGANVMMNNFYEYNEHARLAEERLKAAATMDIGASFESGGQGQVSIRITNSGCGHYLPTGITELRQMWVHLIIVDGTGSKVYESGTLDKKGVLDPKSVIYNTVLGDSEGKPTGKVWEAEKILSDNRIPPRQSTEETHIVDISGTQGPYKVTATLKYRSVSQDVIDKLLGKDFIKVPVVDMVTKETTAG